MSITDLLAELERRNVHIEVHAEKLRFHPQSAVTPEIIEEMKIHKGELLAILEAKQAGSECFDVETIDSLHDWIELSGADGSSSVIHPNYLDEEYIDPPDPCKKCGGFMFWWNALNEHRCMRCDPPKETIQLIEFKHRIQRQDNIPIPSEGKVIIDKLRVYF